jgi:hypothetical protein
VHKIEEDLDRHLQDRKAELERERRLFATKLDQQNDRIALDVEVRSAIMR